MTIWLASGNEHKKAELAAIFKDIPVEREAPEAGLPRRHGTEGISIRIPSDAGIVFCPEENAGTFAGNALLKARALFGIVREPVIADDSGLCVDALGGRPGIYSARYTGRRAENVQAEGAENQGGAENPGGRKLDAAERNVLLLEELKDAQNRSARFICAMAVVYGEERFFTVQESLEGEIVSGTEAAGTGGFGYDPVFLLPEKGHTLAELSAEEKNEISHRGKAGRLAAAMICRVMREAGLYQSPGI
ncbi:MAG: non-canonical purine NTP pyrophosphatase [Treponema sp.]|jgi:XTP/dITP diphosphohydrolase|nr:non-canonical purine NTP pyrophosphatase [Treponema sp.]